MIGTDIQQCYNKVMFVAGLLSWWYGRGWRERSQLVGERIVRTFDYFSVDLLVKTWFAPFRQISAGSVKGSISVMLRAWVDRLISRVVGAFVRTFMIVFGVVTILLQSILGVLELIFWAVLPLLPIVGAIMAIIRWVPSWIVLG